MSEIRPQQTIARARWSWIAGSLLLVAGWAILPEGGSALSEVGSPAASVEGELLTHAHAEITTENGCSGTYNVHVSAKTAGVSYDWSWSVTGGGADGSDNGWAEPAPIHESDNGTFDLSDGETLSVSAWIARHIGGDDHSDSASVTCSE